MVNVHVTDDTEVYIINDIERERKTWEVACTASREEVTCSCCLYQPMGMLCKHVIWVLKHKNIRRIPDKYILNIWTKNVLMKPVIDKHGNKMEEVGKSDNKKRMINELWEEMYSCVSLAEENDQEIQMLIDKLRELKMQINQRRSSEPTILNTMSEMERIPQRSF
ncbi:protein FAR1-RELATED SEQUENCE 3-like [Silene latifolia]|uniref:protein FAR1-RELATED SEQUENCE 3-like n=1 Tax=Silene latifolia TaxID=37657 RepID=UPI003D77B10D